MVLEKINEMYSQLFSAEKKVAKYIRQNPELVTGQSISELAENSGTSEATVIRMCKRLGFKGFYQLKISLARDGGKQQLVGYFGDQDDPETAKSIIQEIARNLLNISTKLEMSSLLACAKVIRECESVYVVATGNTSPVAIDFAFRLGRLGIRAHSSLIPEYYLGNINLGTNKDVVIGISHSGSSIYVIQALELGKEKGMKEIAITDDPRSPVSKMADHTLCATVEKQLFKGFGATTHIYTIAVLDVLLYFVANLERTTRDVDDLEMLLAEYKL